MERHGYKLVQRTPNAVLVTRGEFRRLVLGVLTNEESADKIIIAAGMVPSPRRMIPEAKG